MRAVLGAAALILAAFAPAAHAQDALLQPSWSFSGPFGTIDRASAQRGFQIYNEVCSNCHSLKYAYYRDLSGIGLTPQEVAAVAASKSVPTINDQGQPAERPAVPSDHFRLPFPNDLAARAALNGALPPDLSVMDKARAGGADYIFSLLQGYVEPPAGTKVPDGLYYNKYFPGHQIAMPPPLAEGAVTFADGTKATLPQMAHDVATFLTYIANPEMEQRKRLGVKIMIFLALLAGLTYVFKRQVWAAVH